MLKRICIDTIVLKLLSNWKNTLIFYVSVGKYIHTYIHTCTNIFVNLKQTHIHVRTHLYLVRCVRICTGMCA